MDDFYSFTNMATAILDNKKYPGILRMADVCTEFHRGNPEDLIELH
jgi:hypothetical protein